MNASKIPDRCLQVVGKQAKQTPKEIEAYHISEPVRRMIADEFLVVKSTRRLAKKYALPRHVVNDILHLHNDAIQRHIRRDVQTVRAAMDAGLFGGSQVA